MISKIELKKKFLIFIILNIFFVFFYLFVKHTNTNDSSISEWLINYQGGFTRRGLGGEINILISNIFDIPLRQSIFIFQSIENVGCFKAGPVWLCQPIFARFMAVAQPLFAWFLAASRPFAASWQLVGPFFIAQRNTVPSCAIWPLVKNCDLYDWGSDNFLLCSKIEGLDFIFVSFLFVRQGVSDCLHFVL